MSFDLNPETKWSSDTSLGLHVTTDYGWPGFDRGNKNKRGSLPYRLPRRRSYLGASRQGKLEGTKPLELDLTSSTNPQLNASASLHHCEWPLCLL